MRAAAPASALEAGFGFAAIGGVFANPSHDFPKRIHRWIDEMGALRARRERPRRAPLEWSWRGEPYGFRTGRRSSTTPLAAPPGKT